MAKKTGRVATADSYDNFVARVGMQQPNQHAASTYRANYTSRNRLLIEWAYRSSWIIGAAVDSKADDMTKKGVRITSEIDRNAVAFWNRGSMSFSFGIASTRR
ncbi:phage-associated protein, family [Klebsiella pneumoniae]|nr:phage-associated protein, family [Klebsiella pneumoniae]